MSRVTNANKIRKEAELHSNVMKVWYQSSLVLTKSPGFYACWGFLYECPHEISSTSYIRKLQFLAGFCTPAVCRGYPVCSQALPGKQNFKGHGGDMAGWWYWCLSACLSRKLPDCVARVYLSSLEILEHTQKQFQGKCPKLDISVC